jgi:hypothetical protein
MRLAVVLLLGVFSAVNALSSDRGNFLVRLESYPAGTHNFFGYALMRFDNTTNTLSFTIYHQIGSTNANPAVPATTAAIRKYSGLGVPGPLLYSITSVVSPMKGSVQLMEAADLESLYTGRLYLGISIATKEDYIRGNLTWNGSNSPGGTAISYEYAAEIDNAQITSIPGPTGGKGGVAILYTTGNPATVYVNLIHNVPNCNQITLRRGRVGQANVTHFLAEVCNGASCDHGTVGPTPVNTLYSFQDKVATNPAIRLTSYLDQGTVYLVLHNTANPDGEARGQVTIPFRQTNPQGGPGQGSAAGLSVSSLVMSVAMLMAALAWF